MKEVKEGWTFRKALWFCLGMFCVGMAYVGVITPWAWKYPSSKEEHDQRKSEGKKIAWFK